MIINPKRQSKIKLIINELKNVKKTSIVKPKQVLIVEPTMIMSSVKIFIISFLLLSFNAGIFKFKNQANIFFRRLKIRALETLSISILQNNFNI